ncbi:MAG: cysteine methyltransferase [Piscirickettsiaceae bacterium]|nr:MAG: cysteine methyltransferase [Piscirickettsiaceae bacterium]
MRLNPKFQIIWSVVKSIPKGCIATYGDVARLAGFPRNARFVGTALKAAPSELNIPWHRVINSQGKISFPSGSDKFQLQKRLLQEEGVSFVSAVVNLNDYRWKTSLDEDLWRM